MVLLPPVLALLTVSVVALASAIVEGDCHQDDRALKRLSAKLSKSSLISCLGQPMQLHNANRYWGTQYSKNASVVVYPTSSEDVSSTVTAAKTSHLGRDFAVVGGAHGQLNASSAYGLVVDLSWMNSSRIVHNFDVDHRRKVTAVEYEGGANWGQVQQVTNGTGYTAIGARVSNVGVGGFSLGGGIGFLAGAYGFAIDRLVQVEVVLATGKIVNATKHGRYSDLFWSLQGGSGQFGIVTRFWQEAAPEPEVGSLGFYYINDEDVDTVRRQTVDFFNGNKDPFSVVYYSFGYLPASLDNPTPDSYAKRTLLVALHFQDPKNPGQLDYKATFANLLSNIDTTNSAVITTAYSDLVFVGDAAFPYGYRRGFFGPQTSKIDAQYLKDLTESFYKYLDKLMARGETPYSASFIVQYMFPGLNGNLPRSDSETAWPHSRVGHQTLFSPAYTDTSGDRDMMNAAEKLSQITYRKQKQVGKPIESYPNYMTPFDTGKRVYGDNIRKLIKLKQKYDPKCLLRNGRVFASPGCIRHGFANLFAE